MKAYIILSLLSLSVSLSAQDSLSMTHTYESEGISMSDSYGSSQSGIYRYYAKGSTEPYTGVLYAQYPDGQMESVQDFVDGLGQGKFKNYYRNGNLKEIGTYHQNRVEGPIEKYREDGSLLAKGTYKDWRIKVGNWIYYDATGNIREQVDYGEKGSIEEVKEYYARGDISKSWYDSILRTNGFAVE